MAKKHRKVGVPGRRVMSRLQGLLRQCVAAKSVASGNTWRRLHRIESNINVAMGNTRSDVHRRPGVRGRIRRKKAREQAEKK